MAKILEKIGKFSLYFLVFLLPVFFLPFSFEVFEFNKQYLLFFLVSLAFFCWIAKMVFIEKEIRFKKTPLDIPVLTFLIVAILSAVFSVDRISSLFGFYGRFSDGLIGLLSLGIFYFLITNNLRLEEAKGESGRDNIPSLIQLNAIIKVFLFSVFLVILMTYFSIFGVWQKISNLKFQVLNFTFQLPQIMLRSDFNPAAGSLEGLTIFLAIVVVFLAIKIISAKNGNKFSLVNLLILTSGMVLLLLIDFAQSWVVIIIPLVLFVSFALWTRMFRDDVNKLLLPILLIIFALFSLFTNLTRTVLVTLPGMEGLAVLGQQQAREIILSQSDSWKIGFGAVRDNLKNAFLGSGIGTFHYDFSKFKPVEFNQSQFWQYRFDRPANYITEVLATMGILGLLSYFALIGLFLLISWLLLGAKDYKQLPFLTIFLALLISQLVYYQNTTLVFTFWFMLALSVMSWQKPVKEKTLSFKDFPELSLVFNLILIFLSLAIVGFYFFAGQFYLADTYYAQSLRIQDNAEKIKLLEKAVKLNPYQTHYKIILARIYYNQVSAELQKPAQEQDQALLTENVAKAIAYLKGGNINNVYIEGATEISPNRVAGWETLGMVYRDIRLIAEGALDWAIKSFSRAVELEPANPVLRTELGKLYLVQNEIEKAKSEFEKAFQLKAEYTDAQIQLALTYEREENSQEAIKILEELVKSFPGNPEALMQLGRLYYNSNRLDEAIPVLNRAVEIAPNFSNARYILGLIYQQQGNKDAAIFQFEKVLELNPGNEDVQQKLEELKKK